MNDPFDIKNNKFLIGIKNLPCLTKKGYLLAALFVLSNLSLSSQVVWELEIDSIFIVDGKYLSFINQGEISKFECDLYIVEQKDFDYVLDKECSRLNDSKFYTKERTVVHLDKLINFKSIAELSDWLRDRLFVTDIITTSRGVSKDGRWEIEYFNKDFLRVSTYKKNNNNQLFEYESSRFIRYKFLLINKSYYAIILLSDDAEEVDGAIFPSNETMVAHYYGRLEVAMNDKTKKQMDLSNFNPKEHFRVKKVPKGYQLYDKIFYERKLQGTFDRILLEDCYIIAKKKDEYLLYDRVADRIVLDGLKAVSKAFSSLQIILDDSIRYVDCDGLLHDTLPKISDSKCYQTGSNYDRQVGLYNNQLMDHKNGFMRNTSKGEKFIPDSIRFDPDEALLDITYLDGTKHRTFSRCECRDRNFDASNHFDNYLFTYRVILEGDQKLMGIRDLKPVERAEWSRKIRNYNTSSTAKDSLQLLLYELKDEYELETIIEGEIDTLGYCHPIRFKQLDLYGYYPQSPKARYAKLEKFDLNYAAFSLPDGREGWLDLQGNEYFKDN